MIDKELESIVSIELASKEDLIGYEAEKQTAHYLKRKFFFIVSTRGVFVIETKHFDRTKGHEFYFDGNMIQRKMPNGKIVLCPKLLPQMDGEARFIHDEIKRRTEMDIYARNKGCHYYWLLYSRTFRKQHQTVF